MCIPDTYLSGTWQDMARSYVFRCRFHLLAPAFLALAANQPIPFVPWELQRMCGKSSRLTGRCCWETHWNGMSSVSSVFWSHTFRRRKFMPGCQAVTEIQFKRVIAYPLVWTRGYQCQQRSEVCRQFFWLFLVHERHAYLCGSAIAILCLSWFTYWCLKMYRYIDILIHIDTDSLCFLILFLSKPAQRFNTPTLLNSFRVSGEFLPRLRSDDMAGLCYHICGQAIRRYCPWPPRRYLWTEGSTWDWNGWSDIAVWFEEMDVDSNYCNTVHGFMFWHFLLFCMHKPKLSPYLTGLYLSVHFWNALWYRASRCPSHVPAWANCWHYRCVSLGAPAFSSRNLCRWRNRFCIHLHHRDRAPSCFSKYPGVNPSDFQPGLFLCSIDELFLWRTIGRWYDGRMGLASAIPFSLAPWFPGGPGPSLHSWVGSFSRGSGISGCHIERKDGKEGADKDPRFVGFLWTSSLGRFGSSCLSLGIVVWRNDVGVGVSEEERLGKQLPHPCRLRCKFPGSFSGPSGRLRHRLVWSCLDSTLHQLGDVRDGDAIDDGHRVVGDRGISLVSSATLLSGLWYSWSIPHDALLTSCRAISCGSAKCGSWSQLQRWRLPLWWLCTCAIWGCFFHLLVAGVVVGIGRTCHCNHDSDQPSAAESW